MFEIVSENSSYVRSFDVEDESAESSQPFVIDPYNTIVTEDRITIQYFFLTIFIFAMNGNNAAFYQELFPLEDFDVSIRNYTTYEAHT